MQALDSQRLVRHSAIRGMLIPLSIFFFSACIKASIPIPPPPGSTGKTSGDSAQGSYDTSYSSLWQVSINGTSGLGGLIQTSDGGFVGAGSGNNDANTFRLDSGRNVLWQKNLGGTYMSVAWSVAAASNGGFVVAGLTQSNDGDATDNHGGFDGWVYKLDDYGNVIWKHCMGGTGDDQFANVLINSDGTIMVAGHTNSNDDDVSGNHGGDDLWLVKLDANGNKLWSKCYGGSGDDILGMVQATSDGGFVLTGSSSSTDGDIPGNNGGLDIVVLKLDANGNKQWVMNYGGPSDEMNAVTIVRPDGSFVVAGSTGGNGGDVSGFHGGSKDMWVVKLDNSGTKVWQSTMGGSDDDEATGLVATSDGGFVVGGFTYSYDIDPSLGSGGRDAWLVKLSSGGSQVWQKPYGPGGAGNTLSDCLINTTDGGIVSGGTSGTSWLFKIK
jgi:hypothetical protein